jgi:hypothetical protein
MGLPQICLMQMQKSLAHGLHLLVLGKLVLLLALVVAFTLPYVAGRQRA